MRVVCWNIRAGGGRRIEQIAGQLKRWRPDVVALSEFRATLPSQRLASLLRDFGLVHQRSTADPARTTANCLLLASRWPLRRVRVPGKEPEAGRWLIARVDAPRPLTIGTLHVPNMVSGRKYPFLEAVLRISERWSSGPALFAGDTNSGRRGIDEESPAFTEREEQWIAAMTEAGWPDAFRLLHPRARAYTWYSPNAGNGFRLDQAFVNQQLLPRLREVRYVWGTAADAERRDALSDHAAMIVELYD
ncbi:MAG: endonuclease/exonuclease/phosphatase family protein [Chloroflexi bacterium]|nr:endonuclease/exonuclease/phosphatase family protein [Chloroflexota bacterium]